MSKEGSERERDTNWRGLRRRRRRRRRRLSPSSHSPSSSVVLASLSYELKISAAVGGAGVGASVAPSQAVDVASGSAWNDSNCTSDIVSAPLVIVLNMHISSPAVGGTLS